MYDQDYYINSIRVWYDRVQQVRERISEDGLEGDFWVDGQPSCIQSQLEMYSSTALKESWTHVGGDGFYTAVGESWKHILEPQRRYEQ